VPLRAVEPSGGAADCQERTGEAIHGLPIGLAVGGAVRHVQANPKLGFQPSGPKRENGWDLSRADSRETKLTRIDFDGRHL
jgi:hypothetical protein